VSYSLLIYLGNLFLFTVSSDSAYASNGSGVWCLQKQNPTKENKPLFEHGNRLTQEEMKFHFKLSRITKLALEVGSRTRKKEGKESGREAVEGQALPKKTAQNQQTGPRGCVLAFLSKENLAHVKKDRINTLRSDLCL
jgi:hypothetical protein